MCHSRDSDPTTWEDVFEDLAEPTEEVADERREESEESEPLAMDESVLSKPEFEVPELAVEDHLESASED